MDIMNNILKSISLFVLFSLFSCQVKPIGDSIGLSRTEVTIPSEGGEARICAKSFLLSDIYILSADGNWEKATADSAIIDNHGVYLKHDWIEAYNTIDATGYYCCLL